MVRVHGELGATEQLLRLLDENGVQGFSSLEDIEEYIRSSQSRLDQLWEERAVKLTLEIQGKKSVLQSKTDELAQHRRTRENLLNEELGSLRDELNVPLSDTRNPVVWISSRVKRWKKAVRREKLETDFKGEVDRPIQKFIKSLTTFEKEVKYQETHFNDVLHKQMEPEYEAKAQIDGALKELSTWISGAKGEREALNNLQQLSDDYCVINNVLLNLDPPMRAGNKMRYFCQIDHVVVGPTGVYCIETKNWSPQTQQFGNLRSPIKQVRFNGKALWREIQNNVHIGGVGIGSLRVGKKKISVRNVVAMMHGTSEYTQNYVKVLPTQRLCDYIEKGDVCFSTSEIKKIVNWTRRASTRGKKAIETEGEIEIELGEVVKAILTLAVLWGLSE